MSVPYHDNFEVDVAFFYPADESAAEFMDMVIRQNVFQGSEKCGVRAGLRGVEIDILLKASHDRSKGNFPDLFRSPLSAFSGNDAQIIVSVAVYDIQRGQFSFAQPEKE